jgi:hypothetical protein
MNMNMGTGGTTDSRKLKYLHKNLSQCHSSHHNSHSDCPGTPLRLPQSEASNLLLELWPCQKVYLTEREAAKLTEATLDM